MHNIRRRRRADRASKAVSRFCRFALSKVQCLYLNVNEFYFQRSKWLITYIEITAKIIDHGIEMWMREGVADRGPTRIAVLEVNCELQMDMSTAVGIDLKRCNIANRETERNVSSK